MRIYLHLSSYNLSRVEFSFISNNTGDAKRGFQRLMDRLQSNIVDVFLKVDFTGSLTSNQVVVIFTAWVHLTKLVLYPWMYLWSVLSLAVAKMHQLNSLHIMFFI